MELMHDLQGPGGPVSLSRPIVPVRIAWVHRSLCGFLCPGLHHAMQVYRLVAIVSAARMMFGTVSIECDKDHERMRRRTA